MSRSISREDFNELKNYLGVYLQQGRVILDSDWNESQDIAVSFLRRLNREALGEGSPNNGFAISPVIPPPPQLLMENVDVDTTGMDLGEAFAAIIGAIIGACLADLLGFMLYFIFGPVLFFMSFPGKELEGFESLQGFLLSSPQGKLRIGRDRPYAGKGFLRLSGHAGPVTFTKTLTNLVDLSAHELATFRYRLNQQVPGTIKFFLEDNVGNRSVWLINVSGAGTEIWLAGFAAPLNLNFHILTSEIDPAVKGTTYTARINTFSGQAPITWSSTALPTGLALEPGSGVEESRKAQITGTPTANAGDYTFTVTATDSAGKSSSRTYTLRVKETGAPALPIPSTMELLGQLQQFETPTGTPADLTRIRKYGFEVYQDATTPLIWDFDDLRLASSALEQAMAKNNFIIRGSEFSQFLNQITLLSIFMSGMSGDGGGGGGDEGDDELEQNLLNLMNTDFQLSQASIENAGRLYVAGLPVVQIQDTLYSQQADPNDPPLAPPAAGVIRKDEVYLDVWTEPVTYVEDPEIREIALGGPDTTTRLRTRHRVRVAQGGEVPKGNGVGKGTLATEGVYLAQANRFYRVEIDTPGNIGTATFRWSEDNASTLQRVLEPIPPGSTQVVVEDASAFHAEDWILISKEFGEEEHQIASTFGNVITLKNPTGAQLALLPAASQVPQFTTFSLEDRPRIQRWNAFKVPIQADPEDATISGAILLNDGVQVRLGGHTLRRGDYWNFKTRYLAGDEASGINPETRIEQLSFQRARGVIHHYVHLATITRDGSALKPDRIFLIQDRRKRVANAGTVSGTLPKLTGLVGTTTEHLGGLPLPPTSSDAKFVIFWSGDLYLTGTVPAGAKLTLRASFYSDEMGDLETEPDKGKIQDREVEIPLTRKPKGVEVPLQHLFTKSDTPFGFLPTTFIPTSVQMFVKLTDPNSPPESPDPSPDFSVELANMRVIALELKKAY
ncbi:MAG: putative Ig domain-containing protein [Myxococcaceae bacterium]|nr:putative Ig domain-containing protein [Myxococcaceae bacterium]